MGRQGRALGPSGAGRRGDATGLPVFWNLNNGVNFKCLNLQVSQAYIPRMFDQRESELDAKARMVQEKVGNNFHEVQGDLGGRVPVLRL